jgi:hypothetical protein
MFLEMEILYLSSFGFISGDPFYLHNLQASDHLFDLRPSSSSSASGGWFTIHKIPFHFQIELSSCFVK